jgi:hypothetical protein
VKEGPEPHNPGPPSYPHVGCFLAACPVADLDAIDNTVGFCADRFARARAAVGIDAYLEGNCKLDRILAQVRVKLPQHFFEVLNHEFAEFPRIDHHDPTKTIAESRIAIGVDRGGVGGDNSSPETGTAARGVITGLRLALC